MWGLRTKLQGLGFRVDKGVLSLRSATTVALREDCVIGGGLVMMEWGFGA